MYDCMLVCMYVWMYVCMYICMHVCNYVYIYVPLNERYFAMVKELIISKNSWSFLDRCNQTRQVLYEENTKCVPTSSHPKPTWSGIRLILPNIINIYIFFLSHAPVAPVGLIEAILDGRPPPISRAGFRFFYSFLCWERGSYCSGISSMHVTLQIP